MYLLRFVLRTSGGKTIFAVVVSLFSGAINAALLVLIHNLLQHQELSSGRMMGGFVGLVLLGVACALFSQIFLVRLYQQARADLRLALSQQILTAPLHLTEEVGAARLLATLTDDVSTITHTLTRLPGLAMPLASLVGGIVYLGWLSWSTLLAVLAGAGLCAASYWRLTTRTSQAFKASRDHQDRLHQHYHTLIEGIKEIKLHRLRRESFIAKHLKAAIATCQHYTVVAWRDQIIAQHGARFMLFMLIGVVLYIGPTSEEGGAHALTGYILVILYLMGPLTTMLSILPVLGQANVALQKVEELGLTLQRHADPAYVSPSSEPISSWSSLELAGVTYTYHREQGKSPFSLGPIDLTLCPGELVFIVGSNGSGKSTFIKLLTGLYAPDAGEIRWDGQLITTHNRESYHQLFSVVFSDYYLFESLLGLENPEIDRKAQDYLSRLQLNHHVEVQHGVLSTTELSQGQRKRLTLLTTYLEDRSIYIFDEWASDQDPQFKEIFYTTLLTDLKNRGKTILVISHDTQYCHLADRVITLENGNIITPQAFTMGYGKEQLLYRAKQVTSSETTPS